MAAGLIMLIVAMLPQHAVRAKSFVRSRKASIDANRKLSNVDVFHDKTRNANGTFQNTLPCGTLNDGRWQPSAGSYERSVAARLNLQPSEDGDVSTAHFFEWKPSQGEMAVFDADKFCELLPGNILLVGDSLTQQHAGVLYAELGGAEKADLSWYPRGSHERSLATRLGLRLGISSRRVCNGTRMVAVIRNDWLDTRSFGYEYKMANPMANEPLRPCPSSNESDERVRNEKEYCVPWSHPDIIKQFSMFILNSGAHFVDDDIYAPRMKRASEHLKAHVPDAMVFFRTTVPGLASCERHRDDPPFDGIDDAERYVASNDVLNWGSFQRQNVIAKEEFEAAGFSILDVYPSTVLRRDLHRLNGDCLHFRQPGPFPHWNRLLMTEMLCTMHNTEINASVAQNRKGR